MFSNPKQNAAPKAKKVAHWKLSSPGLKRIRAPVKEIKAAIQRIMLMRSLRNGIARNIAITGFRNVMEIASETGMNVTDANIKVTPIHPNNDLPK